MDSVVLRNYHCKFIIYNVFCSILNTSPIRQIVEYLYIYHYCGRILTIIVQGFADFSFIIFCNNYFTVAYILQYCNIEAIAVFYG